MRDRNAPLNSDDVAALAWEKMGGLLPAVVQDCQSDRVLMLGYMNREALAATIDTSRATFLSRSKGRLWQKGETSGNHLYVEGVYADCDADALLVRARPQGPTCHLGTRSCFGGGEGSGPGWLTDLAAIVAKRARSTNDASYTRSLIGEGVRRIAQKVGEEGVEVALAAVSRSASECAEELADLLYHVTVMMEALDLDWADVVNVLKARHAASSSTAAS